MSLKKGDVNIGTVVQGLNVEDLFAKQVSTPLTSSADYSIQRYIKKVPKEIDLSSAQTFRNMFLYCDSLEEAPNIDTSTATDMRRMFGYCKQIKSVPVYNISNVIYMSEIFTGCINLTEIPLLDTSNAIEINSSFYQCIKLTHFPSLNFGKVKYANYAFSLCNHLVELPLFNLGSAEQLSGIFQNCTGLVTLGGFEDLGKAYSITQSANYGYYRLDLHWSTNVTEQSLINVLTKLYDIATKGVKAQQIILGSTNLAKLTSEEGQAALTQAQNYGWTIS